MAYPAYDVETYKRQAAGMIQRGVPVLVHANGDAAIDAMIEGVAGAVDADALPDHRSVIIHAQLMRADQLPLVGTLGIVPSYYAAHPFFWGDWHRRSFGEARAAFISPMQATLEAGIPFTIHNDAPVVPPDIMRLIHIAVNRTTRRRPRAGRRAAPRRDGMPCTPLPSAPPTSTSRRTPRDRSRPANAPTSWCSAPIR